MLSYVEGLNHKPQFRGHTGASTRSVCHEAVAGCHPSCHPPVHIKGLSLLLCTSTFTTPSLLGFFFYWLVHLAFFHSFITLSLASLMQLTPSFVLILGILFRITLNAYAIPLSREQMGVVRLPLKQTPMRRDLHPQMVRLLISCSSKAYCNTIEQLLQIHNARAQRRLARMTGRAVEEVDRLAVRGTARIGLPGAKLGSNNNLNTPSACALLPSVLTVLSLRTCASEKASASDFAADTAGDGFSSADAQAPENSTLTIANTPTTANSLGLNIEGDDVGYIATIQMGTPPRDFKLLMDSGSADLWVGSEGCQSQGGSDCVSAPLDFLLPNLLIPTDVGKSCVSRISVFIFICGYAVAFRNNVWFRGRAR